MSRFHEEKLKCPSCGKSNKFTMWESVNTKMDPELKEKVFSGDLFKFKCSKCGEETSVNYDFLYHIMEDSMMIHYAPTEESAKKTLDFFFGDGMNMVTDVLGELETEYKHRIVPSMNELREKALIFEEGLDDRTLEICKCMFFPNLYEQAQADLEYSLFYVDDEGEWHIEFRFENGAMAAPTLTRDMYDEIHEIFSKIYSDDPKDNVFIDMEWALDVMKAVKK